MKKVFWFGLLLSLLFVTPTIAAYNYTLTASSATSISATLSGAKGSPNKFQLIVRTTPFPAGDYNPLLVSPGPANSMSGIKRSPTTEGVVTVLDSVTANTTYYVRFIETTPEGIVSYATPEKSVKTPVTSIASDPLTFDTRQTSTVIIKGRIDPQKSTNYRAARVQLSYSRSPIVSASDGTSVVAKTGHVPHSNDAANKGVYTYDSKTSKYNWTTDGTYNFMLERLVPGATYYYRHSLKIYSDEKIEVGTFVPAGGFTPNQADPTITPSTLEFDYDKQAGTALIKGTVDTTKNPLFQNYQIRIQYSKEDFSVFTDTNPLKFEVYKSHDPANVEKGIASDGKYHIVLTDITPSTKYNIRETITFGSSAKKVNDHWYNSDTGLTLSNTQTVQSDIENRSYRLLAPFPGLTVFMDPDLCAEQAAAGNTGQICDINDFLNFAFKVLIGAAAVLLVLRIMYEGFVYITSDIPKLKLSAKGHLMDGILGLLLALSAYLILNTINPKIVENTVSIDRLEIGIEGDTDIATEFVPNNKMPSSIYCPGSGRSANIGQIAKSFTGKVTYTFGGKNASVQSDGNARLDCSGWVNTVLTCAGYKPGTDFKNAGTAGIFQGAERVTMSSGFTISGSDVLVNNKKLNPGDLIGWTGSPGHVLIYIGGATFMDSHGGSGKLPGNAIGSYSASTLKQRYGSRINYVKRTPL